MTPGEVGKAFSSVRKLATETNSILLSVVDLWSMEQRISGLAWKVGELDTDKQFQSTATKAAFLFLSPGHLQLTRNCNGLSGAGYLKEISPNASSF